MSVPLCRQVKEASMQWHWAGTGFVCGGLSRLSGVLPSVLLCRELGTLASGASRGGTPALSRGASANGLSAFLVPKGADLHPVTSAFSIASSSELSAHGRERGLPAAPACTKSRFAAQAKDATHSDSDSDKLVLSGEHLDGDVDLNHVTELELRMAKARMDQAFNQNRLRPGDPGYVYDKEVDFAPATENNDWDEDDEEDDEDQKPQPARETPGSERDRVTPSTPSMHDQHGRDAGVTVAHPMATPHSGLTIDVRAGGSAESGALGTGSSGAKDGTPGSAFGHATGRNADLHAEFSYGDVNSPQPESVVDEVSATKFVTLNLSNRNDQVGCDDEAGDGGDVIMCPRVRSQWQAGHAHA
eukprot:365747-Chlamydomonas_euryale.AAC.36